MGEADDGLRPFVAMPRGDSQGWIKLWRQVDSSAVSRLPHSNFRVWCWVLTNAVRGPTTVAGLDLEAGEMLTTYGRISEALEWRENRSFHRLSLQQLRSIVRNLVELSMLELQQEPQQGCLRLKVLHWEDYQDSQAVTVTGTATEPQQDCNRRTRREEERSKKEPKSIGQNGHEPEGFVDWWTVYPRKIGKGAARAAYAKALKKCSSPVLLQALEEQIPELRRREPRYVANPATWLNQERWADEGFIPRDPGVDRVANLRKLRTEMGDGRVRAMCETPELWKEVCGDA